MVRLSGGSGMHHGVLVSPRDHHGDKSTDCCLLAASVFQKNRWTPVMGVNPGELPVGGGLTIVIELRTFRGDQVASG